MNTNLSQFDPIKALHSWRFYQNNPPQNFFCRVEELRTEDEAMCSAQYFSCNKLTVDDPNTAFILLVLAAQALEFSYEEGPAREMTEQEIDEAMEILASNGKFQALTPEDATKKIAWFSNGLIYLISKRLAESTSPLSTSWGYFVANQQQPLEHFSLEPINAAVTVFDDWHLEHLFIETKTLYQYVAWATDA